MLIKGFFQTFKTFGTGTLNCAHRRGYVGDLPVPEGEKMFCHQIGRLGAADMDGVKHDVVIFIPDVDDGNMFGHIVNIFKPGSRVKIDNACRVKILDHIQVELLGVGIPQSRGDEGDISIIVGALCDGMYKDRVIMVGQKWTHNNDDFGKTRG